jgi:hypothetical protein
MRLSEGDVARLYERRQRLEIDRDALLDEAIASAPIDAHEDFAFLHIVARPTMSDESLFDRARGERRADQLLNDLFSGAVSSEVFSARYSPDLSGNNNYVRSADGWAVSRGLGVEWEDSKDPGRVLECEIGLDGSGYLFCGRAAAVHSGRLLIFEDIVAGLTARFLAVLGGLYAAGSYLGPVDLGLAVTGLRGGISFVLSQRLGVDTHPFNKEVYRRTEQVSASALQEALHSAARPLVLPLIRTLTRESYDPFSN